MMPKKNTSNLAAAITKSASLQTYYTIRLLVDRERVDDAYRAYAYFRWVDDTLDSPAISKQERLEFAARQRTLLESCYRVEPTRGLCPEEEMLIQLVLSDIEPDSGLQSYLRNMMAVMEFDADRRGRAISEVELENYTHYLASAVTEAMHYFIGHNCYSPHDESRYLAVTAAHITHMLRDMFDDIQAGYYNIPGEFSGFRSLSPQDLNSYAARRWVQNRVKVARSYFKSGKIYLNRVGSWRCKLAGFAYTARFEWLLDTLEREGYSLRPQYDKRNGFGTQLNMIWRTLSPLLNPRPQLATEQVILPQPSALEKL